MIWATVSSRSCFCWLYRASASSAAKNIISLISVLTIDWFQWFPCVESSLVLLEEAVCYDQCILLAKLCYPLPCFILYSKAKLACLTRCFLTSYFCIPAPMMKRTSFWGISSRRVSFYHELSFLGQIQHTPVYHFSAESCNFGVLAEDEHSFYSTILWVYRI